MAGAQLNIALSNPAVRQIAGQYQERFTRRFNDNGLDAW